jgi:hypothetical protein
MSRLTPNAARTPSWIWWASASRPAVLAWPGLTRASVCLLEMRAGAGPGPACPLPKPAYSISQAAGTLTWPGPAG